MNIPAYESWLRKQPCSWCYAPAPSDPSHVGSGTNKRLHDEQACSHCSICHRRWHGIKVILNNVIYTPFTREEKAEIRQRAVDQFAKWLETLPIEKRQNIIKEIYGTNLLHKK